MYEIFQDMLYVYMVVHLDDILIFSSDIDSHQTHNSKGLARLRQNILYAELEKCSFKQPQMPFLGYIIYATTLDGPRKIKSHSELPPAWRTQVHPEFF